MKFQARAPVINYINSGIAKFNQVLFFQYIKLKIEEIY